MANPVDLDRLDALFAAATKHYAIGVNRLTANRDKALEWAESTYNAYPALAAELRTLRARVAELEDDSEALEDGTRAYLDLIAERDRLRAELAEMREDDMAEIEDLRRERSELLAERDRLRSELAEARRDGERLDWMEKQLGSGLISDDFGHWSVSGEGMQSVPKKTPADIQTTFFVEAANWCKSVRAAIDAARGAK